MPTRRDKQVKDALSTRSRQVQNVIDAEILRAAREANPRWWGGRGDTPRFVYCAQPIELDDGRRGWASWVENDKLQFGPLAQTVKFHRRRRTAKARAWNLWQGWRLARGLKTNLSAFE